MVMPRLSKSVNVLSLKWDILNKVKHKKMKSSIIDFFEAQHSIHLKLLSIFKR